MTNSNAKGNRTERELVNKLDDSGFAVMRAPASGSATERELPDALAGQDGEFYAIEAKSSSDDVIYIDGAEIDALEYFADNFGATALIGVRFNRQPWYFLEPDACYVTDGGNYRVKLEAAQERGKTLRDLYPISRTHVAITDNEYADPDSYVGYINCEECGHPNPLWAIGSFTEVGYVCACCPHGGFAPTKPHMWDSEPEVTYTRECRDRYRNV